MLHIPGLRCVCVCAASVGMQESLNTVETQILVQLLRAPQYLKGAGDLDKNVLFYLFYLQKLIQIDVQCQTDQEVTIQRVIV